jgi:dTDP-glucose 4,6-dehydratase
MIIYVDVDETICISPPTRDYAQALPLPGRIERVNKLYDEGNTIVYWTARGTQTGIDWYELTKDQLTEWGAKHHDLKLGKPHFDLYICDKSINSERYFKKTEI